MHIIDQSLQSIYQVLALSRNRSAQGMCILQLVTSSVNGLEKGSHLTAEYYLGISKMYFSLWKPPGVSERMWSVNLDASISEEYQTLGGHSGQPSE